MNYRMIFYLSGQILRVLGVLMLLPLLVALIYNEPASRNAFAVTALVLIAAGTLIAFKKPKNKSMYNREGLAAVAIAWLLVSVFGAIPFCLSGDIPNFADCIFEMTSGFTTTGSTILTDIESMSKSCLFWRSFSHFLGGMGVLVFMLAILPHNDTRTMHIVRAESPGPTVGKLVAKMSFSVRILYGMYIALTVLEMIFLLFGGMNLFEAINHAFATAGTGGFGVTNGSIADYDSVYIDVVITVFMMLFGINFSLYYLMLMKKFSQAFKNEELRVFLCICVAAMLIIAVNITHIYGSFWQGLRYSSFQVLSTISTTGFATADFTQWPILSQIIIILLMFVGGCAGSTGGGLKVMRIILLFKIAIKEIRCVLNPRAIVTVKCDGKAIDKDVVRSVSSYFVLFAFLMALSILILSLDGHDVGTTTTAVITCLNNVGPGIGEVGPSGNFSVFSDWAKLLLSLDMLLGRLEIYPLLVLFTIRKNK
ncbi:MAG: TrkH family potassium uptake protein [Ruminococcus sp.]|nr:TrkH family potassium uptake protein [Ruminococcus sp.]